MAKSMRNWLLPLTTCELRKALLGIRSKAAKRSVSLSARYSELIEGLEDGYDSKCDVDKRSYEDDGSNLRIQLKFSIQLPHVVQLIHVSQ